jgi:hypothetical protein
MTHLPDSNEFSATGRDMGNLKNIIRGKSDTKEISRKDKTTDLESRSVTA